MKNLLQGMAPRREAKPVGNLIVRVNSINKDAGTMDVTVMTGPSAGKDITFKPSGHLTVAEYAKTKHDSFTREGAGTLRVEGLKEGKNGVYECRWARTFLGNPREDQSIAYDKVSRLVMLPGDNPRWSIRSLNIDAEVVLKGIGEEDNAMGKLRDALAAGFKSDGNVTIFAASDNGVGSIYYYLGGERTADGYKMNDPEARATELMADLKPEVVETLKDTMLNGVISVVPTTSVNVGKQTAELAVKAIAEAEEKGVRTSISTVDPATFESPSLGRRVAMALSVQDSNAIPKEKADSFRAALLADASETVKEKFHTSGWQDVPDEVIRKTFEAAGFTLPDHGTTGYAVSSYVLNPYDEGDDKFISKTYNTRMATPYPAVEALKDVRQEYFSEVSDALKDFPEKGVAKEVAKEVAKADVKTEAEAKADADPEMDENDIDDILNSVAGDNGLDDPDSDMQI